MNGKRKNARTCVSIVMLRCPVLPHVGFAIVPLLDSDEYGLFGFAIVPLLSSGLYGLQGCFADLFC